MQTIRCTCDYRTGSFGLVWGTLVEAITRRPLPKRLPAFLSAVLSHRPLAGACYKPAPPGHNRATSARSKDGSSRASRSDELVYLCWHQLWAIFLAGRLKGGQTKLGAPKIREGAALSECAHAGDRHGACGVKRRWVGVTGRREGALPSPSPMTCSAPTTRARLC